MFHFPLEVHNHPSLPEGADRTVGMISSIVTLPSP